MVEIAGSIPQMFGKQNEWIGHRDLAVDRDGGTLALAAKTEAADSVGQLRCHITRFRY